MTSVSLNLNIRELTRSATVELNEHSNELLARGRRIFKLGLGQSPFPVPEHVVQALRDNAHQKDYLPVKGLARLRAAVAGFHQRHEGVPATADDVLVGPGSKELMFLLQLAYYGDIVIPTPCWVSYAPQAQIVGRHVRYIETSFEDKWRLRPESLEKLCKRDPGRPRIVILNYPGNPEGATYSDNTLRGLAEVAHEYGVIVLSDEIYGMLNFQGRHISIARHYPEGTIVSSGLSKWCGAGGWRLGTFTFPPALHPLREAMSVLASETFTSTSAPIQYAAVAAFEENPAMEEYLRHARRVLASLGYACARRLRACGARVIEPEGAFYLFPDFGIAREALARRAITTSAELSQRALDETGVAFLPGSAFGRPEHELTARLAYVDFDGGAALAASREIPLDQPLPEDFLLSYCPRVIAGVSRLADWIRSMA
ncbi:aminotransferase class I/II-fold pyridoxal phosphate-dependent enzyme [bacterium]|nr:aminotransferase class I/II-fold pyridoxal phosphate-dependent enzyme [bacterium]